MLVLMCGEVGLVNHRYGKRWKKKVEKESKNYKFTAYWLRHSFATIAVQLGFSADIDVGRAVGKKVKGETSQSGYSHDAAVDKTEDSRAMYERVQA